MPPRRPRNTLSVRIAPARRRELAPRAMRVASSCWRPSALTRRRLATLAQAMRRTTPMLPISTQRTLPSSPTTSSLSGRTLAWMPACSNILALKPAGGGNFRLTIGIMRATSAFACARVTPGLSQGDSRLEPGDAAIAEVSQMNLGAVEAHGKDEVGLLVEKAEGLRHDAGDAGEFPVDDELAADSRRIAAELALPVAVGEDRGLRGGGGIVRQGKPAAGRRLNSQRVECSFGDVQASDLLGNRLPGDRHAAASPDAELLKGAVFLAKGEVVGG